MTVQQTYPLEPQDQAEAPERARLRDLEQENRELRARCAFLEEVARSLAAELREKPAAGPVSGGGSPGPPG